MRIFFTTEREREREMKKIIILPRPFHALARNRCKNLATHEIDLVRNLTSAMLASWFHHPTMTSLIFARLSFPLHVQTTQSPAII